MSTIRLIEELSLNALPSLKTVCYDGWVLRFADGFTRRANSVNPLYPSSLPLDEKIDYCEQVYAGLHKHGTVFKLTAAAQPPGLADALIRRGYHEDGLTSVQTLDLAHLPPAPTADLTISEAVTDSWLTAYFALNEGDLARLPLLCRMLGLIVPAIGCFCLWRDGAPEAVGLAVIERGWAGLYDIAVRREARKNGVGTALVLHMLDWARGCGAHHAYLQVVAENTPALRLYGKLGFTEAYRYWYLQKANK
jgi:GNAT superfamily N-acetyltransferase